MSDSVIRKPGPRGSMVVPKEETSVVRKPRARLATRDDGLGNLGEKILLKHYHTPLVKIEEPYGPDFYQPIDKRTVELKTDIRATGSTGNLFVERWSNFETQRAGGP